VAFVTEQRSSVFLIQKALLNLFATFTGKVGKDVVG